MIVQRVLPGGNCSDAVPAPPMFIVASTRRSGGLCVKVKVLPICLTMPVPVKVVPLQQNRYCGLRATGDEQQDLAGIRVILQADVEDGHRERTGSCVAAGISCCTGYCGRPWWQTRPGWRDTSGCDTWTIIRRRRRTISHNRTGSAGRGQHSTGIRRTGDSRRWVSLTVTVKVQVGPTDAVHVTVVVPFGKKEPGAGTQVTVPQEPVVVGAG